MLFLSFLLGFINLIINLSYMAYDEEVKEKIVAFVPARRTLLIQECVQAKRLSVISLSLPDIEKLPSFSYSFLAHIIHAWYISHFLCFLVLLMCVQSHCQGEDIFRR
jgi:hypothetical protein